VTRSAGHGSVDAVSFAALPRQAAWQHRGARAGFEVVFFDDRAGECLIHGCTAAIEDGMLDLKMYSAWLIRQGLTNVEEVLQVVSVQD